MQIEKITKTSEYVIRIEPGEKLMASLEKIMRDAQVGYITFEIFTGGGFTDIECSFSEKLEKGGSVEHKLEGSMELGGAGGNISWIRNDPNDPDNPKTHTPAVHCHVCLGDKDGLRGYVAHLKEATVKLTAEIKIEVYKEKIFRKLDETLGLMLLDLPNYSSTSISQGQTSKPNEQGGSQQGQSEEIEKLKKELGETNKKIQELRKLNFELNKTNTELSKRLTQNEINVSPNT